MRLHKTLVGAALLLAVAGAAASEFWRRVDNPGPVIGPDGQQHAASCSAYPGTDPTFRFWTRRGSSRNLVVYFEGGGACWDDLSCTFPIAQRMPAAVPQFFSPAVPPNGAPRELSGLFDLSNPANPVKDWTIVYIPYCTGDIHLGSATRTYRNVGHPVYKNLPDEFEIRHKGFDNFMVVLDWMQRNVRAPQQVLVTGASAGGYGATGNFPWVARTFPNARLAVLADGAQGVTTPGFDTGTPGRGSWNPQLAPWVFGDGDPPVSGPELMRAGAEAYPQARFGQFTNALDAVQVEFYTLMKTFYGPGGSCADPAADWNQQMLATLGSYRADLPNFRAYVAPGTPHTILRSPAYYTDQGTGTPFDRWLAAMLAAPGRGAPAWEDVACPDCLTPVPCPAR